MDKQTDIDREFAERVRAVMQDRGLTVTALAKLAGMHHPSISNILRGVENCSLERAQRIADALDVPLSSLV